MPKMKRRLNTLFRFNLLSQQSRKSKHSSLQLTGKTGMLDIEDHAGHSETLNAKQFAQLAGIEVFAHSDVEEEERISHDLRLASGNEHSTTKIISASSLTYRRLSMGATSSLGSSTFATVTSEVSRSSGPPLDMSIFQPPDAKAVPNDQQQKFQVNSVTSDQTPKVSRFSWSTESTADRAPVHRPQNSPNSSSMNCTQPIKFDFPSSAPSNVVETVAKENQVLLSINTRTSSQQPPSAPGSAQISRISKKQSRKLRRYSDGTYLDQRSKRNEYVVPDTILVVHTATERKGRFTITHERALRSPRTSQTVSRFQPVFGFGSPPGMLQTWIEESSESDDLMDYESKNEGSKRRGMLFDRSISNPPNQFVIQKTSLDGRQSSSNDSGIEMYSSDEEMVLQNLQRLSMNDK